MSRRASSLVDCFEAQSIVDHPKAKVDINGPFGTWFCEYVAECFVEGLVNLVANISLAFFFQKQSVSLDTVDANAIIIAITVKKAESVAIYYCYLRVERNYVASC